MYKCIHWLWIIWPNVVKTGGGCMYKCILWLCVILPSVKTWGGNGNIHFCSNGHWQIHTLNEQLFSKILILSWFLTFLDTPIYDLAVVVNLAARDIICNLEVNTALLERAIGLDPCLAGKREMMGKLVMADTLEAPNQELWRVPLLWKLLSERLSTHIILLGNT